MRLQEVAAKKRIPPVGEVSKPMLINFSLYMRKNITVFS